MELPICKIIEGMMRDSIQKFVQDNGIISDKFMKDYSCQTNLLSIYDEVREILVQVQ